MISPKKKKKSKPKNLPSSVESADFNGILTGLDDLLESIFMLAEIISKKK